MSFSHPLGISDVWRAWLGWCYTKMQQLNDESADFINWLAISIVVPVKYKFWNALSEIKTIPIREHSVENPNMVDPQWNILYWKSRCIFPHSLWGVVGCEWATTSVYIAITYICFIPRIRFVFAVGPQYQHKIFLLMGTISFEGHKQNLKKIPCRFKTWMGL